MRLLTAPFRIAVGYSSTPSLPGHTSSRLPKAYRSHPIGSHVVYYRMLSNTVRVDRILQSSAEFRRRGANGFQGQEVSGRHDEGTTADGQVVNSVMMLDRH